MIVDAGVFLDKQIARWHIGFRLIVVVITDEILDCIIREKLAELTIQLRRQCFVWRHDNGRFAGTCNHVGHGVGFARASHTEQSLKLQAVYDALCQLFNGLWLIARRWKRLM